MRNSYFFRQSQIDLRASIICSSVDYDLSRAKPSTRTTNYIMDKKHTASLSDWMSLGLILLRLKSLMWLCLRISTWNCSRFCAIVDCIICLLTIKRQILNVDYVLGKVILARLGYYFNLRLAQLSHFY